MAIISELQTSFSSLDVVLHISLVKIDVEKQIIIADPSVDDDETEVI